jgi:Zn finger protein HypA/HybF involved in hydrogenase expression
MLKFIIIIAVVAVVIIFNVIRIAIKSSNHHFECPNCEEHFQASFFKSFFTAHSLGGKYSITCPKCRKTNMLTSLSGKK